MLGGLRSTALLALVLYLLAFLLLRRRALVRGPESVADGVVVVGTAEARFIPQ
jgi:hypothetical protein